MGLTLPPSIRLAIMDPRSVKILVTVNNYGDPHLSFTRSLRFRNESELEYDEFHDNSVNSQNMYHAVWTNKIILLNIASHEGRSFKVAAKPRRAVTTGDEFHERSEAIRTMGGGNPDLGTVWIIEPLSYIELPKTKEAHKAARPGRPIPLQFPKVNSQARRLPLSFF